MAKVILDDLTKRYDAELAVNKINLDIKDGEFVTLVGPSGCGKSTTLEMTAGLTELTSGSITIGDRDVSGLQPKDRNISMVFQNIALFPHLNVNDNVSFGLDIRNYDEDEIDRQVERALEIVQLPGMNERMPDELSGGQRQRVAIARAIVQEPEVFLMDEPLANLDAKLRIHMRTELQRLHKQLETTIIYVTHDQAEAMTMSDRIAVLNEGELQQFAPPLTCYNKPENVFVAGFIGSPSMNLIDGRIVDDGVATGHFSLAFQLTSDLVAGDDVIVGIRPEDIYLASNDTAADHPSEPIEAIVDILEPMGDEIFVYLTFRSEFDGLAIGDEDDTRRTDQLLMSVNPDADISEGDQLSVVLDLTKAHLFDRESGRALQHNLTKSNPLSN